MSNSPTELHKHPSGCGQRWGSGGSERKAETEPDTAPDNSPSHPNLCRLSVPLPPYAHEPNGGGAGQPRDPSGGGCRRDAVRNPCILTAPNQKSDTTLTLTLTLNLTLTLTLTLNPNPKPKPNPKEQNKMIHMEAFVIPTVSLFIRCLPNCTEISNDNVIDLGPGLAFVTSLITVLGPLGIRLLNY